MKLDKSKSNKSAPSSVKELNAARYNPRSISESRLKKLKDSIGTFGDLSGVVFNMKTQTLISGHQRMTTVRGAKTKIVQKAHTDEFGTVAVGHIEVKTKKGVMHIPFRAVDWDLNKEKAANIAANAHGGVFDKEKLAMVLADLEKTKKFDIDIVGLDPLTIKSLRIKDDGKQGPITSFKEYDEESVETEHQCPKCKFRY